MRQDRQMRQQVVICKIGRAGADEPNLRCGMLFMSRAEVLFARLRRRVSSADTASSTRDCGSATSGDCRGRRRAIRDRQQVYDGDNRCGDGADSRLRVARNRRIGRIRRVRQARFCLRQRCADLAPNLLRDAAPPRKRNLTKCTIQGAYSF